MKQLTELLLVSGSPRRQELLDMIDVRYRVLNADIDETPLLDEAPEALVRRLALGKAQAGRVLSTDVIPALGADTIVVLKGEILLKPGSREEAERMLRKLSACQHEVISAVAVALDDQHVSSLVNRTQVTFAPIPDDWIVEYCKGDEPMDKAGAYAVQGLTARWISHIDGSFSGVMGLPLFETATLLHQAGLLD